MQIATIVRMFNLVALRAGQLAFELSGRARPTMRGASMVEYALLIAFIAIVCVGAVTFLGSKPSTPLSTVGSALRS